MHRFLAAAGACLLLGGAACAPLGQEMSSTPRTLALPDTQRVRNLLAGIADDVGAIAESFSGGLDNPHDPAIDSNALKQDAARLAAATSKANELQAELERVRNGAPRGG